MIEEVKKEIQRQLQESEERLSHINARGFVAPNEEQLIVHLKGLLSFIDALEVKEVDLDIQTFAKEMDTVFALPSSETKNTEEEPLNWEYAIAKHFFELGLKVAQKGGEV